MNTLVYYKLNAVKSSFGFPWAVAGVFCDGVENELIWLQEQGEILFEFSGTNIAAADSEFLKHMGLKKMSNDVVCYLV